MKVEKLKQHSYFKGLTEEQKNAIFSDSKRIGVDASAGSGKTRVLIARILRLLKEGKADLGDIVAITFTEKASAEMRQRLRDAFHECARDATSEELNQWRWREQQLESARICTIHSFCSGILRQYALKLGFDPEFRVLDELQSPLFLDRFIQSQIDLWLEQYPEVSDLSIELSPQGFRNTIELLFQKALHIIPWLDEVKNSTVEEYQKNCIERIEKQYEQYLPNYVNSSAISASIKQIEELNENVPEEEDAMKKVCQHYLYSLRDLQKAQTLEEILSCKDKILNSNNRLTVKNRDLYNELKEKIKNVRDEIKKEIENKIITLNWENPQTKKSFLLTYRILRLFDLLYSQWVQYKREQGVVDFDDLIYLTSDLLKRYPKVCHEIAEGIKYIFIDEFQDTDHAQVQLIQLLLSAPSQPSFFFVGDAKQSIYAFRNAEVKVFQEQREKIGKEHLFSLDYNFRSAPEILSFINIFFEKSNALSSVEKKYRPMKSQRDAYGEPRVEFLLSVPTEENSRTLKEENVDIEAKSIAERIELLVNGEHPLMLVDEKTGQKRPASYSDFTLLFCTKNYIYKYEKALKDRGIPCFVVSSRGFFEITEVKDILNFLHVLLNPRHNIALLSFLRGPFCGLSDEQIVRWQMKAPLSKMLFDWENLPEGLIQDNSYKRVYSLYQYFRRRTHLPIHELIQEIIDKTGYESILSGHWFREQKIANLQKFLSLARAYQEKSPVSLYQFHRFVERSRDKIMEGEADLAIESENAVVLTTIHQAKGLEFPVVILPLLYEKRQYKKSSILNYHKETGVMIKTKERKENKKDNSAEMIIKLLNNHDEYQEYIRLFYVALTRARDYLILSSNKEYLEEFYKKRKINSRLSLLADCFPIKCNQKDELFHVEELPVKNIPFGKKDLKSKQIQEQTHLIKPIPITEQYFEKEPIPVIRLLDFLFDTHDYDSDKDIVLDNSLNTDPIARGIFYHHLLQLWDFKEDNRERLSKYLQNIMGPNVSEDVLQREREVCVDKIMNHPVYPLLKANPPIQREIPFIWKLDNYYIQGTVDAVLEDGTVVDYKTGSNASKHSEQYWKQLEIYYYAIRDLGIKLNNKLILVYIDQSKYDIKDIDISHRNDLKAEICDAIRNYIRKINQGCEK